MFREIVLLPALLVLSGCGATVARLDARQTRLHVSVAREERRTANLRWSR